MCNMDKAEFCSVVFCCCLDCTINTYNWQMWNVPFKYHSLLSNLLINGFTSFWYMLMVIIICICRSNNDSFQQGLTLIYFYHKGHTRLSISSSKNEFLDMKNIGLDTLLAFLSLIETMNDSFWHSSESVSAILDFC